MAKKKIKINFEPTRDWIVLPVQSKDTTKEGIKLIGNARKALRTNILPVIAAGPNCEQIRAGMTVMVHPQTEGLIVDLDEGQFVMINEFSICGILPE